LYGKKLPVTDLLRIAELARKGMLKLIETGEINWQEVDYNHK
jgi:hypothetical protein